MSAAIPSEKAISRVVSHHKGRLLLVFRVVGNQSIAPERLSRMVVFHVEQKVTRSSPFEAQVG